jgi:hypothetical protein
MTRKDKAHAKRCKEKLISSLKRISPGKNQQNADDYKLYCGQCRLITLCWSLKFYSVVGN